MFKVRKAVIPVAGFGTRFLPATKSTPKEMLPIVDKPIIQFIVEEAVNSGIETIIFITGRHKRAIEDYFDYTPELEFTLKKGGKEEYVDKIREISNLADFVYVRQKEQLGLGHAILCAESVIGNEPFAVLLGDELIINDEKPALKQLIDVFDKFSKSVIGTMSVDREDVYKYGIVDGMEVEENIKLVKYLVEKPSPQEAPSTDAIAGRYILTPKVFDMLKKTPLGKGGELQLTDALQRLREIEAIYSTELEGKRYDTGNKYGYLLTMIKYASLNKEYKNKLKKDIKKILNL
jgi:UTP--glucose-1-phosphate uridylyltransferase